MDERFIRSLDFLGSAGRNLAEVLAEKEASVSVRVNVAKGVCGAASLEGVPWCTSGFYLPERPLFAADPQWHQGLYYVQEASSMAASAAMRQLADTLKAEGDGSPLCVLDACAAPGGKTIGIIDCLDDDSFVVANEADARRCNILLENLTRWGSSNVAVTRADARAFGKMTEVFDIIAADVPCSGEGMMRKEEEAERQWSPELVRQCSVLQRDIVDRLWNALRPGGFMLYSTCTFNRDENEAVIKHLTDTYGAEPVALELSRYPGVFACCYDGVQVCRFLPGRVRGEGFTVAALRKPGIGAGMSKPARQHKSGGDRSKGRDNNMLPFLPAQLMDSARYVLRKGEIIEAVPVRHAPLVDELGKVVRVVRAGLPVAELRGKEYIPTHETLLCLGVSGVECSRFGGLAIPSLEVELPEAYSYLRGNAMTGLEAAPKGLFAVMYRGRPLGLAKGVGNRANNLLPAQLRLRLSEDALIGSIPALTTSLPTEQ